jgi:chemotaxis response regulator CheB
MRSQGEKESFTQPRYHRYWSLTWGLDALCTLLRELPRNLPASIFVVMHVGGASALSSILNRCGAMPVVEAREGEKIERGRAYVAPSDRHTLLAERLAETASSASRDVKLIREILDRL